MAENAVVTTALAGLDAALDGDLLVQAMLVTPMFGLGRLILRTCLSLD